ncbi:MAG TPA: PilC/PilY family type IV pilus protein [Burkholderiales bacterium]|nr:PilC/PilY family type IV pilus protein [Burkholderiales bacterium]
MIVSFKRWLRRVATLAAGAAVVMLAASTPAEDIDLFVRPAAAPGANSRPNILFVIDNSSNWSAANQHWPDGIKQGQAELQAIRTLVGELGDNVNVGLMMFTNGGAYVRFHVRQMTPTNKAALQELIGDASCADGANSLNGTPNCIYKNFNGAEKIAVGHTLYSGAMFDAFKYFGGFTDPANATTDVPGAPIGPDFFGVPRHSNFTSYADPAAYTDAARSQYRPPIDSSNSCAKNFLVFIGNGFPPQDASGQLLANVRGTTTQLAMPTGNGGTVFPSSNRVNYADEWAKYLYTTDVNAAPGQQNVSIFAIDVYRAQQDANQTLLLRSLARHGGGRYFAATSSQEILQAMREIAIDIQSVSSVFTSAALPVSAANRTVNLNEVYFGSFRPDNNADPRWFGNLKRYQLGILNDEVKLTDRNGVEAISDATGQLKACATSFWSTDSGNYWNFSPSSAGTCTLVANSIYSDAPDGSTTEKGGAAEVIRRGNNGSTGAFSVSRNVLTCSGASCASVVTFNTTNVAQAATGAVNAAEHQRIIDYTRGHDVNDENGNGNRTESRPSLHGDVIHSGPLPVNYGGANGVVLYYGTNDGSFRAVRGSDGRELWSFVAPEHHGKLKRLVDNSPLVSMPGVPSSLTPTPKPKDYLFDGSAGLYQNADNTKVWLYPSMRRGGRMIYGLNVTDPTAPRVLWKAGCPNADNDTGCTTGFEAMGQTWSRPNVARIKGYSTTKPVIVVGGGYDKCEDEDTISPTCSVAGVKGKRVYVIDAEAGTKLAEFTTLRSVAADVALVDRNFDGMVDYAYVADTGGNLYRVEFSNPSNSAALAPASWTMTHVAHTQAASGRKFLSAPAVLATKDRVYVAIGSGDRERPLMTNYPYVQNIRNRFYMFVDTFAGPYPAELDGAHMTNFSASTTCASAMSASSRGWYMDLEGGRGEQVVSSATLFGGIAYFNTNRPVAPPSGTCSANLGEARGYAVNMLNASGTVGTTGICGGERSGVFQGGGLPATPVAGLVTIGETPVSVLVGAVQRDGGPSAIMNAQRISTPSTARRSRVYWYTKDNN